MKTSIPGLSKVGGKFYYHGVHVSHCRAAEITAAALKEKIIELATILKEAREKLA
jgi:hypothetical protein